jgi:nucleotide-binding universal stress UspA family protein
MIYSNILIPVDGSPHSENAAQKGIELAKQLSSTVTLLCVIDVGSITSTIEGSIMSPEIYSKYEKQAAEVVHGISQKYPYDKLNKLAIEGIPFEAINDMAKKIKADLIIMGTHGRTGLGHLFVGSVAERVIRHSEIPVIVVPLHLAM